LFEHIHHTDIAFAIGTKWAVLCDKAFVGPEKNQAQEVIKRLTNDHNNPRVVVSITEEQMYHFCGQIMELRGKRMVDGKEKETTIIVMSDRAYNNLRKDQIDTLQSLVDKIVHVSLENLEMLGGGSTKGLIAELF